MRDVVVKIQELVKALGRFKALNQQNAMVPAIKAPTLKPLSMPSVSQSSNTKIPGVEPPSNKDPKKVAEQLKNPRPKKPSLDMIKIAPNGQWLLQKKDEDVTGPESMAVPTMVTTDRVVNPAFHAFGYGHHKPEQDDLIRGLDMSTARAIGRGRGGAQWMNSLNHDDDVIVKNAAEHPNRTSRGHLENNFNSAKREVMYHNLAKDFFNMGHYVPLTAGFHIGGNDYSAQKRIPNASHVDSVEDIGRQWRLKNSNHEKVIQDLVRSGELDKIALMDNIMGHHDRHRSNYLINDAGDGMHLIDNGTSFDYKNFDPRNVPHFYDIAHNKRYKGMGFADNKKLHSDAEKWLMNLDPKKAATIFANHSYSQDAPHVKGFLTRLKALQDKVRSGQYKDVESLLADNRLSSGPMMEHKEAKDVA